MNASFLLSYVDYNLNFFELKINTLTCNVDILTSLYVAYGDLVFSDLHTITNVGKSFILYLIIIC